MSFLYCVFSIFLLYAETVLKQPSNDFSKTTFIQPLVEQGFHVISNSETMPTFSISYTGEYAGSGRPAHFADKVKLNDLDSEVFTQVDINEDTQVSYADFNRHYFVFCQHYPVYTLGRNGHEENLLLNQLQLQARGVSFFHTNRGGDITFHGPGQVVGYLIFDLEKLHLGLKVFIYKLEEVIIRLLEHYGLQGARLSGATGVWPDAETSDARKICAIGLRSSHFVTMHGFALNVNTDLNYFNYIHPCGFVDKGVTSLQKELGRAENFLFSWIVMMFIRMKIRFK